MWSKSKGNMTSAILAGWVVPRRCRRHPIPRSLFVPSEPGLQGLAEPKVKKQERILYVAFLRANNPLGASEMREPDSHVDEIGA
jgi:hypothetical protein